jgi:hypothetical protein
VRYLSVIFAALAFGLIPTPLKLANAQDGSEPPKRQKETIVQYIEYAWWLTSWDDNQVVCQVYVDHEGLPEIEEVFHACGFDTYNQWLTTPSCSASPGEENLEASCEGLYFFLQDSRPMERVEITSLPPMEMWVSLEGCQASDYYFYCRQSPVLQLAAVEPIPNEDVVSIYFHIDGQTFVCLRDTCEIPLPQTSKRGLPIRFWSISSFGDHSEQFTAKVRNVAPNAENGGRWQVNVLSSQWLGDDLACCSDTWAAFPPTADLPLWLQTPRASEELASDVPYTYLAGRLIAHRVVDATDCLWNGGFLANGSANTCGLEKSRQEVDSWQNRFDTHILQVAQESGVPGQLMKNIIAQESQFWPGPYLAGHEHGLSQITEMGADAVLFWNPDFYDKFCPTMLSDYECQKPYTQLDVYNQMLLRGALAVQAGASCPDCPYGIDLEKIDFGIDLLAQALLANCEQISQILFDVTGRDPGEVSDYVNLWRLVLANYNAGSGCVDLAVRMTWVDGVPLVWDDVAQSLPYLCRGAIDYVHNITQE